MRALWGILCTLGAGVVQGACGGETDADNGPSGSRMPEGQLVSSYAKVACSGLADCCRGIGAAFDESACRSNASVAFQNEIDQMSGLGVTYDAARAGDCLAGLGEVFRSCGAIGVNDVAGLEAACEDMFRGPRAIGAPCSTEEECSDTPVPAHCKEGICEASPGASSTHGKLGEGCNTTCTEHPNGDGSCSAALGGGGTVTCYTNDGLRCDFDAGTCRPLLGVDESCSGSLDCVAAAWCDFTSGTCVPKVGVGQACLDARACADLSFCDPSAGVCATRRPDGSPCERREQCTNHCHNGVCSSTTFDASDCANPDFG